MSGQDVNSQRESYSYRSLKNRERATGKVGKGIVWGWVPASGPKKATETSQWLGRWKVQGAAPADSARMEAVFLFISHLLAQSGKPASSLESSSLEYQCYSLGLTPSNQPSSTAH